MLKLYRSAGDWPLSRVSKTSINVRLTDQHKCHSHLMENVALHYRIEHASHVDYSKVDPVYCEVEGFGIRIEDNRVRFEMKEHYATVDSALEAVKPYIHSWELDAALRSQPGEFKLKFCGAEVEDRKPIPGKHEVSADPVFWEFSTSVPTVTKYRPYPKPPDGVPLELNDDVRIMLARLADYFIREKPPGVAYFSLTMLEELTSKRPKRVRRSTGGRRSTAAEKFQIERDVLDKVGDLSSEKGGLAMARKAEGRD